MGPLRDHWESIAAAWATWARTPGHDSYWRFHRDQFLSLLPAAGRCTVDVGCGEGRLTRELAARGHRVVGVDGSPTLVGLAAAESPELDYRVADAAALPLPDATADLVVAFLSLHDVDDLTGALAEAARVVEPGGRLCMAIVHPLNSAGTWARDDGDAPFTIDGSYLSTYPYEDAIERDGLTMTFASMHRPLEAWFAALQSAGFLVEALREPPVPDGAWEADAVRHWSRVPLFLHLRALRPERSAP